MRTTRPTRVFRILIVLILVASFPLMGQSPTKQAPGHGGITAQQESDDSAGKARLSTVDDMAKRVDSLQFIVVYNAELLRRDLDAKVIWIYVMLGVMIVASMMMYGALNQAQRQRKELEEKVFSQLSSSVADLEAQIKTVEAGMAPPKPTPNGGSRRKKKPA